MARKRSAAKSKAKPSSVETESVPSTVQVVETGSEPKFDGKVSVETTRAVFEEVEGGERGAHRAVFAEGEPRAAEPGGQGGTA